MTPKQEGRLHQVMNTAQNVLPKRSTNTDTKYKTIRI